MPRKITIITLILFLLPFSVPAQDADNDGTPQLLLARCGELPRSLESHGTAVVGNRFYAFGGIASDGHSRQVWSAGIGADATLSDWRNEVVLPESRTAINNGVQVINNAIYIIGGMVSSNPELQDAPRRRADTVLWTTVGPDGLLAPWRTSASFPGGAVSSAATCASENRLYLIGGSQQSNVFSKAVHVAQIGPDGAPTAWREAATMPNPLWLHGAAVLDNRLYIWGGLTGSTNEEINPKVLSAEIRRDDTALGPWREEKAMPSPLFSSGYGGANDTLLCAAGRYHGGYSTGVIWHAPVESGRVGDWKMARTNIETRMQHSVSIDAARGTVFISGGRVRDGKRSDEPRVVLDTIQGFKLPSAAPVASSSAARLTNAALARFLPLDKALEQARQTGKSVVVFFHSPEVPAVERCLKNVIGTPQFDAFAKDSILAAVDISGPGSSYSYQYNVFRVPSLITLNSDGTVKSRAIYVTSPEDL